MDKVNKMDKIVMPVGYENFEEKIRSLGGQIDKIDSEDERAVRKFKMKVS